MSLMFFVLVLANIILLLGRSSLFSQTTSYGLEDIQAVNLAEAGIDKATSALSLGAYSGGEYSLGKGVVQIVITSDPSISGNMIVESTAYIPNKTDPRTKRKVRVVIKPGGIQSLNLAYPIHAGMGGIYLGNNAQVTNEGDVFSNGSVLMSANARISGNLWVGEGTTQTADIANITCPDPANAASTCHDLSTGDAPSAIDIAQTFTPTRTEALTKIAFLARKVGNPSASLRIYITRTQPSGLAYPYAPDPSNVLAQTAFSTSSFTTEYGWFEATFIPPPMLTAGTVYAVVIDGTASANDFLQVYSESNNISTYNGSYSGGTAMTVADNWTVQPANQYSPLSEDLIFKVYQGGSSPTGSTEAEGVVTGTNGATISKNVHANAIKNLIITGEAYYQSIDTVSRVGGVPCLNTKCHPGETDPAPQPFPITDAMIDNWKNEAFLTGGEVAGFNMSSGSCSPLGPKRVNGNLSISGCNINIKTPIYITGNLVISNNNTLTLDSSFGNTSGIIIVDGTINLIGGNTVRGTGASNSTLILDSEHSSPTANAVQILAGNNTLSTIIARKGIFSLAGNGSSNNIINRVLADKVIMSNNNITSIQGNPSYLTTDISAGQTGEYSVIKGTYKSQ